MGELSAYCFSGLIPPFLFLPFSASLLVPGANLRQVPPRLLQCRAGECLETGCNWGSDFYPRSLSCPILCPSVPLLWASPTEVRIPYQGHFYPRWVQQASFHGSSHFQEAIQLDGEIFFALLRRASPLAHRHLRRQRIDPVLYMTEWFMCIFARTLPWASVLRVWDMFFCEGTSVAIQAVRGLGFPCGLLEGGPLTLLGLGFTVSRLGG